MNNAVMGILHTYLPIYFINSWSAKSEYVQPQKLLTTLYFL